MRGKWACGLMAPFARVLVGAEKAAMDLSNHALCKPNDGCLARQRRMGMMSGWHGALEMRNAHSACFRAPSKRQAREIK